MSRLTKFVLPVVIGLTLIAAMAVFMKADQVNATDKGCNNIDRWGIKGGSSDSLGGLVVKTVWYDWQGQGPHIVDNVRWEIYAANIPNTLVHAPGGTPSGSTASGLTFFTGDTFYTHDGNKEPCNVAGHSIMGYGTTPPPSWGNYGNYGNGWTLDCREGTATFNAYVTGNGPSGIIGAWENPIVGVSPVNGESPWVTFVFRESKTTTLTVQSSPITGVPMTSSGGCFTTTVGTCGRTNWEMQTKGTMSTRITAPLTFYNAANDTDYRFLRWYYWNKSCNACIASTGNYIDVGLEPRNVPWQTIQAAYTPVPHAVELYKQANDPDIGSATVRITSTGEYNCGAGCTDIAVFTGQAPSPNCTGSTTHCYTQTPRINATFTANTPVSGGGKSFRFDHWEVRRGSASPVSIGSNPFTYVSGAPAPGASSELTRVVAVYQSTTYRIRVETVPTGLSLEFDAVGEDRVSPLASCATGRSFTGNPANVGGYTVLDEASIFGAVCGADTSLHYSVPAVIETNNAIYAFNRAEYRSCPSGATTSSTSRDIAVQALTGGCDNVLTLYYDFKEFKFIEAR